MLNDLLDTERIDQHAVGVVLVWDVRKSSKDSHDGRNLLLEKRPREQHGAADPKAVSLEIQIRAKCPKPQAVDDSTHGVELYG